MSTEEEATANLPKLLQLLQEMFPKLYTEAVSLSWTPFHTPESIEDEVDSLMRRIKKTNAFTAAELTVLELTFIPK